MSTTLAGLERRRASGGTALVTASTLPPASAALDLELGQPGLERS